MRHEFPVAAYAKTLRPAERAAFAGLPILQRDPVKAISLFERRRRHKRRY